MKQIVHKDMKSANVLVWQFPSGRLSREKRVERAGRVWLKLADYGISQVFTKPIMKLNAEAQKGTPGFMAPELFGPTGQEIATDKVRILLTLSVISEQNYYVHIHFVCTVLECTMYIHTCMPSII